MHHMHCVHHMQSACIKFYAVFAINAEHFPCLGRLQEAEVLRRIRKKRRRMAAAPAGESFQLQRL